ncbi:type II toxin-antitoxin system Phd/YefM family antitoxin [Mycolicibacterium lutetiense]|uniref:Antitoxin n=1 Tax=Mycolicibacterium lutetiense TaxID=1641992 RepID=A0ABS4ZZ20_9MYCO|nr:type II toxin-antitoxin system Phd/YefM family antitoxin [Mycolicibacterium lutetiense]MBP2454768.1 prevent-host-death family protein [Mycolicibacterium lutetiense]
MSTVNIHDAKTHLSQLLARVESGERITIARAGRPVADLVPHTRVDIVFGGLTGRVGYDTEHFDDADSNLNALFGIE